MRQLFYDCQILLLPSYREPFGIVLLEGLWSKCVCIGSRIGAMPDIIRDGSNGYLVEPGDSAALAARLRTLLSDPRLLEQMAETGYRMAKGRWHWDNAAEQVLMDLFDHKIEEIEPESNVA